MISTFLLWLMEGGKEGLHGKTDEKRKGEMWEVGCDCLGWRNGVILEFEYCVVD